MSEVPTPKAVLQELNPMKDTIAVENGFFFEYYPIKFGIELGSYVQLTKLPPVLKEGYVTFNKKLYRLTLQDLIKRRLNVGQPSYGTERVTPNSTNNQPVASEMVTTRVDTIEPGLGDPAEIQISQDADVAWFEQISTLLHIVDPEEEWDYSSLTQSGQVNEGRSVQNT